MKRAKLVGIFGVFALLVAGCGAPAPVPEVEQAALAAAEAWLGQVDAGDYAGSWDTAAAAFRAAVTREQWTAQVQSARGPLGALGARTVQRTAFHTQLPGAPDGEYVVITYQTRFANKQSAVETVTPMRDPDGTWRVSGYFIR